MPTCRSSGKTVANCAHLNGKVHAMPALIKRLHRINAMQLGRATAQRVAGSGQRVERVERVVRVYALSRVWALGDHPVVRS